MSGYSILIVDDEKAQHEILEEHLQLAGYERLHAENGVEAIKIIEKNPPDLILLDIQMSVMDGFETLTVIRKKMGITDIPVIFLSNISRTDLKVKGLELGADDYITKPFESAELIARIRAVLRRTHRYHQRERKMAGNLADITLSDLLQSIDLGNKSAHIRLGDINSDIYIQDGMLISARFANFTGEAALNRIFFLAKGRFSVRFDQISPDIPQDPQPLTSVLMNNLAYVDEVRELTNRIRGAKAQVSADGPMPAFPQIELFRSQFPLSINQLMILMEGTLKENIQIIARALREKQLKIVL